VVFGPDDKLYVSSLRDSGVGGWVLRFNPDGSFVDSFIADTGGIDQLNRPEGLVFGPDGNLYITSFRFNSNDTDSIRIYNSDGHHLKDIDLYQVGENRVYAQALLFGPDGKLFVPISNTGELRSYDINNYAKTDYTLDGANQLLNPWYLTFENTDPHTLNYVATPVPASVVFLVSGLLGLVGLRRRFML
jgi:sugar lactone lactonase YvrE